MKVKWTNSALSDLDSILDYLAERSPAGNTKVAARVNEIVKGISALPYSGVRTRQAHIRRVVALPYPYFIFYQITEATIYIIAVRHTARDPASMPDAD